MTRDFAGFHFDLGGGFLDRFCQFNGFIVFDEEKENRDDQSRKRHQPEGVAPSPVSGDDSSQGNSHGASQGDRHVPESHDAGSLFLRIKTGNHGGSPRSIARLPDADHQSGCPKLREVPGQGAGRRGQTPYDRHQTDGLLAAPAIHEDGDGKSKNDDRPVNRGNQHAALRVGDSPIRLDEGKQRRNHQPVHVVEEVEQEQ